MKSRRLPYQIRNLGELWKRLMSLGEVNLMKIDQKQAIYIFLVTIIFILTACGSSGKDESSGTGDTDPAEQIISSWEREPEKENSEIREQKEQEVQSRQTKFSSVPWFQDDAGKNTQLYDGFLYAYWSNRLCRYDIETLEETVLYEAASAQTGDFCVYEGYVYFLVRSDVTFLDGPQTTLYRVNCDGTGLTKLQELQIGKGYSLDIYEDILYLLLRYKNGDEEENIYLRIRDDGVEQVSKSETLYGMLPDGFDAELQVYQYRYHKMPSLPYAMRNFGYMFLWDAEEKLFRYDPISEVLEQFSLPEEAEGMKLYLTNDSILFMDRESALHRVSLDDPTQHIRIDASCFERYGGLYREPFQYADEKGFYFVESEVGYISLIRVSWEGEHEYLYTVLESRDLTTALNYYDEIWLTYYGGGYFYYSSVSQGDGVVLRVPLEGDVRGEEWEPEQFAVYYESPIMDISRKEKVVTEFHSFEGLSGTFTVGEIYLTDGSGVSGKINQGLKEIYALWQKQIQEYEQIVREEGDEDYYSWDYQLVTLDFEASIIYLDQDYIGFRFDRMEYWGGAAHPMYDSRFMVLDRRTARQVSLKEFTGLSGEELCRIIAPYVEADSEWSAGRPGWDELSLGKESILEDWRFFLSKEGIGIHYNVYEITSYAGGDRDIVVPYEAFGK